MQCYSRFTITSLQDKTDVDTIIGTFNIDGGRHGHCLNSNIYYEWFHFVIVGQGKQLKYYVNNVNDKTIDLNKSILLGGSNDMVYIGGSPDYSAEGIILSKTRWFSNPLSETEINKLFEEGYN